MKTGTRKSEGFTLIELSIVLVIIGLIVGGVLVGRDLITAASLRAQITQISDYRQAVNTFREKYGYLPGDLPDPDASKFGFQPRGQYAGEGDGNGVLEGVTSNSPGFNGGAYELIGELAVFWVDLSTAQLIKGSFNTALSSSNAWGGAITSTQFPQLIPPAVYGQGNVVYAWSYGGTSSYLGVSKVTAINSIGYMTQGQGFSVAVASAIDTKTDDGLPTSGRVKAMVPGALWSPTSNGASPFTYAVMGNDATWQYNVAASALSTTCFDNGNNSAAIMKYSTTYNNGTGINCNLAFEIK